MRRAMFITSIELIYLHSPAHESALNLYRLSLEGELKVEDERVTLINAAIERNTARELGGKEKSVRARGRSPTVREGVYVGSGRSTTIRGVSVSIG